MIMRENILHCLADSIHTDPWALHIRRIQVGDEITGWSNRLQAYQWGRDDLISHLGWLKNTKARAAKLDHDNTNDFNEIHQVGLEILAWGRVTRSNSQKDASTFISVVKSARLGKRLHDAPMNSGWTKIAALFTQGGSYAPQIIWDSRVSFSICTRLAKCAEKIEASSELQNNFEDVAYIQGRGGNRVGVVDRNLLGFPPRYGYGNRAWLAHFAGAKIHADLAQILNSAPKKYGRPFDGLDEKSLEEIDMSNKWTPWLVACVTFMDGY